ncbi:MAG: amidohydrolase [Robiginitomaculum sp.]|nr:MAG: amidohydrolase [Robiginitomaculum sp.]
MKLIQEIIAIAPELEHWRQTIHTHPELAFEETKTSELVAGILSSHGIEVHRNIGGTGLVGIITAETDGPTIALRADMDALPMQEQTTGLAYTSTISGQSHSCGHDGHTTMLLGAALYLAKNPPKSGKVVLIFQPAEETGEGAPRMIEDGLFERFPCDEIYGCHNMPLIDKGKAGMRVGPTLSSYVDLEIDIVGKGGHAAAPHTVDDPLQVAARLVTELSSLVGRYVDPSQTATVGIGLLQAGTTNNVIPETAHIAGTIRSLSVDYQNTLFERITALCEGFSKAYSVQITPKFLNVGLPCINAADQVSTIAEAASQVLGADNVDTDIAPYSFADDFAYFQDKIPGAYYFLGQGGTMVHEPTYNFDDDLLPIGASIFAHVIDAKLGLTHPIRYAK